MLVSCYQLDGCWVWRRKETFLEQSSAISFAIFNCNDGWIETVLLDSWQFQYQPCRHSWMQIESSNCFKNQSQPSDSSGKKVIHFKMKGGTGKRRRRFENDPIGSTGPVWAIYFETITKQCWKILIWWEAFCSRFKSALQISSVTLFFLVSLQRWV